MDRAGISEVEAEAAARLISRSILIVYESEVRRVRGIRLAEDKGVGIGAGVYSCGGQELVGRADTRRDTSRSVCWHRVVVGRAFICLSSSDWAGLVGPFVALTRSRHCSSRLATNT